LTYEKSQGILFYEGISCFSSVMFSLVLLEVSSIFSQILAGLYAGVRPEDEGITKSRFMLGYCLMQSLLSGNALALGPYPYT
jgi:hypothetical protein